MTRFYVYEHVRLDTGVVFYVGKGSGGRSRCLNGRNSWWHATISKAGGFDVRTVAEKLDEELAHLIEMERIDQLRTMGIQLTNLTDGGEGMAGHRWLPEALAQRAAAQRGQKRPTVAEKLRGRPKSEQHRAALAASRLGTKASLMARMKMSATRKGRPSTMLGKCHRPESKAKISAAIRGEKNPFYGHKHSPESRAKMTASLLGRKLSLETRAKMSASRRGPKNPRYGVTIPEDQKARQVASLKARSRITCPHCNRTMDDGNARRWHFDNCRERG
jgi:hypothetical protein